MDSLSRGPLLGATRQVELGLHGLRRFRGPGPMHTLDAKTRPSRKLLQSRSGSIACAMGAAASSAKLKASKNRPTPRGKAEAKDPQHSTARERFEQRRRQWAQLYKSGQMEQESSMKLQADEDVLYEQQDERKNEDLKAKLRHLTDPGEVVKRLSRLTGDPWEFGVECLLSLGDLSSAREAVLAARERVPRKNWAEASVLLADSALKLEDSNEPVDQKLAEDLLAALIEAQRPSQALEVFVQLAVTDAQRAANLLKREREMRSKADPKVLEELKAGAEEIFEKVMERVRQSVKLSEEWDIAEAHRSQIGPGEAFGAWTSKPRIRDRWNTLLRLVAKRRHMPDVFEVCDARRACWVHADHSTTEFIARAAVATVNMTGLVDSFHAMPAPRFPEVVFLGWSNVGKSSLINALLHRTAVAPVSNMPGKTTQFHFYSINEKNAAFPQMTLVDVPGLGEAMADEAQTRHWRSTLDLYLKRRGNMLRQVFHLISCEVLLRRKRPSLLDMAVMEMCLRHRRDSEYTIVITKVDLIKSEEAMETVFQTMRRISARMSEKLGIRRVKIIPCSVKRIRGRILLWRRLWRSVDPELTLKVRPAKELKEVQKELDAMVEQGKIEDLSALAEQESNWDVWDYAMRGLVQLKQLRKTWQLLQQGPAEGFVRDNQEDDEDLMEDLEEDLMEEAELQVKDDGEASSSTQPADDVVEEAQEDEDLDLFQDVIEETGRLSAMQERVAVVLGEAALAREESAEPLDAPLAELIIERLQSEQSAAVAELLMEKAVCISRGEDELANAFSNTFAQLNELLTMAREDPRMTPWTADRWTRLILSIGRANQLCLIEKVFGYMKEFHVRGDKETDAAVAQLVVKSLDVAQQAPSLSGLTRLEGLPEVLLLGTAGMRNSDKSSIATAVVSMQPRRRLEDELAGEGQQGKKQGRRKSRPPKVYETKASVLRINCAEEGGPGIQVLDIPAPLRPSVTMVEKELAKSKKISAAAGGVWGSSTEAESSKSAGKKWREEVCSYLSSPREMQIAGTFHIVDARDFAKELADFVPSDLLPADQLSISQRLDELRAQGVNWLSPDDALIQDEVLRANPAHYVLVVADCSKLTLQNQGRSFHDFYVSSFVAQQRRDFLKEKLTHDAETAAARIEQPSTPKIRVLMADAEQFYQDQEFWRLLWACTE